MSDDRLLPEPLVGGRRVLIVVNSTAGSGKRHAAVQQLTTQLQRIALEPEQIDSLAALEPRAEQLQKSGQLWAIVAAGGDGTVAEVVNRTGPETPIAVFPLGTENLLAKYLQIGSDPGTFSEIINRRRTVLLDAGRANGRLFLLMASVGFDAEVVRRLHDQRGGNIVHWSYVKPILQTIRSYQYPELRLQLGPQPNREFHAAADASYAPSSGRSAQRVSCENSIACRWAFVFNLPQYGGGLKFVPDADATDGLLDWCTFQRGGLIAGLKYLTAIALGRHRSLPTFAGGRVAQLSVIADQPVPYELDGDPGGMLPLTIETVPQRVRVIVPAEWNTTDDEATEPSAKSRDLRLD